MSAILRKKLICFYCGSRSDQTRTSGLRRWQCKNCEAENWLDENGEITDPPASLSASVHKSSFAQTITSPISTLDPITTASDPESLFCSTCLKNQHLYNQSLANFYPSTTHNDQKGYEEAEKTFRKNLDERYPMICEDCEPRVLARLKKVNYDAKADHLLRTHDRLRARRIESAGWKGLVVRLGGLTWALSWIAQMGWHILGLADLAAMENQDGRAHSNHLKYSEVIRAFRSRDGDYAYLALWVGFASVWWNPKMLEKVIKPFGKLYGLSEFYKMQIVSLITRLAVWYWITQLSHSEAESNRGIHLFMIVFCLLSIVISYSTVSISYNPRISFKESPESLTKRRSKPATDVSQPPPIQPSFRRGNTPPNRPHAFSINDLIPRTQSSQTTSTPRLPTPPPEADYDDSTAMDWSPTTTPLKPSTNRLPTPSKPQPSPFHGALPQNIHPPSHRLRNPPSTTFFRAATEAQKASLFPTTKPSTNKPAKAVESPWRTRSTGHLLDMQPLNHALENQASITTNHTDTNDGDRLTHLDPDNLSPQKHDAFARPRFFPKGDLEDETGLEEIMEQAFRIKDTPREVSELVEGRDLAQRERALRTREGGGERKVIGRAVMAAGAAVVVGVLWRFAWQVLEAGFVDDSSWEGGKMDKVVVGDRLKEAGKWFLDL